MNEQRAILEALRDGLVVADADGTVLFANRAACTLLGLAREQLEQRSLASVLADRVRGLDGVEQPRDGRPRRVATMRSDGAMTPVDLVSDEGEIEGRRVVVHTFRSLGERPTLPRRFCIPDPPAFETVLSNLPDAVFVVRDDRIAFANRAAAAMLGVDDPRQLDIPLDRFAALWPVRDPDGALVAADALPVACVLRGETVAGVEQRIHNLRTGREIWLQISGAPLHDASGARDGGVVVATEISRLKQLEQSKDEWLAIAAHELRTPLTPITVHLQMAQRRLHMGRSIGPEVFDKALEQVKRLARLVNGLLDVTRLQAGQLDLALEDVDTREIVESVVDRVRASAPSHTLVVDLDDRAVMVRGDRARLDEVVASLVDNAVKYSPNGGEVWVRARIGDDGAARIEVQDEGIGIAPSERAQLFERYFRAGSIPHTQYGGLGLGLWIAGKVVARHGGHIDLESTLGRGSTFSMVLPRVDAARGTADALTALEDEPVARARVLVVDDDPGVLEAFEGLLDEDGYEVRVARSGPEALARAREWRPDVVLLDLRMPGMDGWEVRRQLSADPTLASVPVVLVSADRDARARAAGMNLQGFVAKPFDVDEIERVLGALLIEHPPMHHAAS